MIRKLDDIAKSLDLPLSTLDRWIRQGRIPVRRRSGEGVFDESVLRKWAETHHLRFFPDRQVESGEPDIQEDSLLAAMRRGGVCHRLPGDDVASVLAAAVENVPGLEKATRRVLYDRLMEREALTSTGIGKGVAIPHPRSPLLAQGDEAVITTCFLENAVAFQAIDDKPVFVLFVLLSSSVKVHLQLLSRLAYCVRHQAFIDLLKTCPDPEALLARVADFETRLEE